jgi:hypothetical protein
MILTQTNSKSPWFKLKMKCDDCNKEYNGRLGTATKQFTQMSKHLCCSCVGRNTMIKVHQDPEFGNKVSQGKKGKKQTETHIKALVESRKRNGVSEKVKEAARNNQKKRWEGHIRQHEIINITCGMCNASHRSKRKTAIKQEELFGKTFCRVCRSMISGKEVGAKQREKLREMMKDGISPLCTEESRRNHRKSCENRIGVPLSEAHRKSLCKPKLKLDKIREAANRPEERQRRSELATKRLLSGEHSFYSKNHLITTSKSNGEILCRSKLEVKFLRILDGCKMVASVESAEYLKLKYPCKGIMKNYLPDFKMILCDGTVIIVEVKSTYYMKKAYTLDKIKCLKEYASANNCKWMLLTERNMRQWLDRYI